MAVLSPTQRFILITALQNDDLVRFGIGDRRGTRVSGNIDGIPSITAYSTPQFFLKQRGLLENAGGNYDRWTYRLTDEGRSVAQKIAAKSA